MALIDDNLYTKLRGLGSFRNILAHEYLNISDEEVFRNFNKMLSMIDDVINHLESKI